MVQVGANGWNLWAALMWKTRRFLCFRSVAGALTASAIFTSSAVCESTNRVEFRRGQLILRPGGGQCAEHKKNNLRLELVQAARREWVRFGSRAIDVSGERGPARFLRYRFPEMPSGRQAADQGLLLRIGNYWAVVPTGLQAIDMQNRIWHSRQDSGWEPHWSAAFISWLMCESEVSVAGFKRSALHWEYVQFAKQNAGTIYRFSLPGSFLPHSGDISCLDRRDSTHPRSLQCFVVMATSDKKAYLIGGNVPDWHQSPPPESGGVALVVAGIDARGHLRPFRMHAGTTFDWFCGLILVD